MIWTATFAVVGGMTLVRAGWNGRFAVAVLGWVLIAAALLLAAYAFGAWGVAIGMTAGMIVALSALFWSERLMPGRPWRPDRTPVAAAPVRLPVSLFRRVSVFLLVVPSGGIAALVLAFGMQAVAQRAGMGAADATACTIFLMPVVWIGLMGWQLTRNGPRRMIAPPVLAATIGVLLWAVR